MKNGQDYASISSFTFQSGYIQIWTQILQVATLKDFTFQSGYIQMKAITTT